MSGRAVGICLALVVVGAAGLGLAFGASARDGWLWLIFDFIFFWGIAAGMLVWAAAFRTAQATWTAVINRFAHAALPFVTLLFGVLIALLAGLCAYAPWVAHPIREKLAWLSIPSFVVREVIAAPLFWIPCMLLVRRSLAADAVSQITDRTASGINHMAVVSVFAFCITASIVAWDFVMSLSPEWVSTMFSVYYFCTAAYTGMAALVLMATALRKPMGLEDRLKPHLFQDMGNLLLAFSLFNMGLFFAQYVTIWYENLPEEVRFIILRYDKGIWPPIGWASFILGYAIPFLLLQSRMIKLNPKLNSAVAALILLGVGIERYVMVIPSLSPRTPMIAPAGVLSVLGFAGLFVLSLGWFLGRYSTISSADAVLRKPEDTVE